jgi:hypothetical protein
MEHRGHQQIELVVDALATRVEPAVDHDTLTAVVEADFKRYESARIRDFVPVLVERDIRQRLATRRSRRQWRSGREVGRDRQPHLGPQRVTVDAPRQQPAVRGEDGVDDRQADALRTGRIRIRGEHRAGRA